jgi:hypothetical protein
MDAPKEGKGMKWIRWHAEHYRADFCLVYPYYRLPNGYGMFTEAGKTQYAHRVMCELVKGPPPSPGHEAAHECGNGDGGCANPVHLSWKTKSENRQDSLKHGTGVRQSGGGKGSLSFETVAEIRELKGEMTQREIAEKYNISQPRVRAIFANKIYRLDRKVSYWTDEDDEKLRQALASGLNFGEASRLLGKSAAGRARRLGLKTNFDPHAPRGPKQPRLSS